MNEQILVQGGAVGIAVALIFLIGKIWGECNKHAEKVIDVVEKNAVALTGLQKVIDENTSITKETNELIHDMNGGK